MESQKGIAICWKRWIFAAVEDVMGAATACAGTFSETAAAHADDIFRLFSVLVDGC